LVALALQLCAEPDALHAGRRVDEVCRLRFVPAA